MNEELGHGAPTAYDRAATLVEKLFEAPADPACWQRMLAALGREISPDAVALVIGPTTPDGPALCEVPQPKRRRSPCQRGENLTTITRIDFWSDGKTIYERP